jgi:hypothetical protein
VFEKALRNLCSMGIRISDVRHQLLLVRPPSPRKESVMEWDEVFPADFRGDSSKFHGLLLFLDGSSGTSTNILKQDFRLRRGSWRRNLELIEHLPNLGSDQDSVPQTGSNFRLTASDIRQFVMNSF